MQAGAMKAAADERDVAYGIEITQNPYAVHDHHVRGRVSIRVETCATQLRLPSRRFWCLRRLEFSFRFHFDTRLGAEPQTVL